jgi:general stress protein CsbA
VSTTLRSTTGRPDDRRKETELEVNNMVFAADYPFLDVLWTMVIFFCWVAWIWIMVLILSDLFRRDVSGWYKALWVVVLIILPFLGTLIYLIANGKGMTERRVADVQASQAQFDSYVRDVAAKSGPAAEIEKAKALLDAGTINQAEYDALKAKALA